jgi:hypothetical protein
MRVGGVGGVLAWDDFSSLSGEMLDPIDTGVVLDESLEVLKRFWSGDPSISTARGSRCTALRFCPARCNPVKLDSASASSSPGWNSRPDYAASALRRCWDSCPCKRPR